MMQPHTFIYSLPQSFKNAELAGPMGSLQSTSSSHSWLISTNQSAATLSVAPGDISSSLAFPSFKSDSALAFMTSRIPSGRCCRSVPTPSPPSLPALVEPPPLLP